MNTTMTTTRTYRPRPLSPETLVKIAQASGALGARAARHADTGPGCERSWTPGEARMGTSPRCASVGGGADVLKLLVDALPSRTDFDALVAEGSSSRPTPPAAYRPPSLTH